MLFCKYVNFSIICVLIFETKLVVLNMFLVMFAKEINKLTSHDS